MSHFDVYAIGNALVDFEYKVTDDQLIKLDIPKGLMTLIDSDRLEKIQAAFDGPAEKKQSGGSAANTIIAFSQLGGRGFYCCKVADDKDGHFYLGDLEANGVSHKKSIKSVPSDITGKCMVMVTPDAERSMNSFLGVTSRFSLEELEESALQKSKYLYIEGYLVASPTAMEAILASIKMAKEYGVKIALTLSDPGIVAAFRDNFKEILSHKVDILFCNEEEALSISGKNDIEEAEEYLKTVASKFVVTLGSQGASGFDGEEMIAIDGFPEKAVDTNGAGDMFAGAFLYGYLNEMSFRHSGLLASFLSSKIVQQYGPRLSKDQMLHHIRDFKNNYLR